MTRPDALKEAIAAQKRKGILERLRYGVAFLGGNYSDKGTFRAQREFVPQLLLPTVR